MKLDYTLKTLEERKALVQDIIDTATSPLSSSYLEILANYLLDCDPSIKREKTIITKNRQATISKRETSYQELAEKFDSGEDGIYNLMADGPNSCLLQPKVSITQDDLDTIPELGPLKARIAEVEEEAKKANGKNKYILKKQAIDLRRDQYVIKDYYKPPIHRHYNSNYSIPRGEFPLEEDIYFDADGEPHDTRSISLFEPAHITQLLCNYDLLAHRKEDMQSDLHYLAEQFYELLECGLADKPIFRSIVDMKLLGKSNEEIRAEIIKKYNITYTCEHISSLWRKKIPGLLAEKARENYIIWYYTEVERGVWKKCTRCGEIKLAHRRFFSLNASSKDGYYSICKCCRNNKNKKQEK